MGRTSGKRVCWPAAPPGDFNCRVTGAAIVAPSTRPLLNLNFFFSKLSEEAPKRLMDVQCAEIYFCRKNEGGKN